MYFSPFTPDYESLKKFSLVDAALMYLCEYKGKESLIAVRNALYIPSMEINLIPPFILRGVCVTVNDKPKIHASDPSSDDHAIIFESNGLKIPLKLNEIFSYFDTSKPTENQVQKCDDVYLLTPEHKWNPHTDVYAKNEENPI